MPLLLSVLSTVFVVYNTYKNLPFDRCIVLIDIQIHRSKAVSNARSTIISRSIDSVDSWHYIVPPLNQQDRNDRYWAWRIFGK